MYSEYGTFGFVLGVHSIVRWLVVGLGWLATVRAGRGRAQGRAWTPTDTRVGGIFVACLDLQVFVGVLLYGVFSPTVAAGLSNLSVASTSNAYRFWLLEHPIAMLIALVLAHVGLSKARRADGPIAHRHAALFFGMALLLILAATPWPTLHTFGRALWPSR